MKDDIITGIDDALFGFQAALKEGGSSFKEYLERYYYKKCYIFFNAFILVARQGRE